MTDVDFVRDDVEFEDVRHFSLRSLEMNFATVMPIIITISPPSALIFIFDNDLPPGIIIIPTLEINFSDN